MDHPLLVGVLHPVADREEETQTLGEREAPFIAEGRDARSLDELHHEVRVAVERRAGVVELRDVRMGEPRQRAALGLEAQLTVERREVRRPHDLERHPPLDRLELLGEEDRPHAALAEEADDPVGADGCETVRRLLRHALRRGRRRRSESPGARAAACSRRGAWCGAGRYYRATFGLEPESGPEPHPGRD